MASAGAGWCWPRRTRDPHGEVLDDTSGCPRIIECPGTSAFLWCTSIYSGERATSPLRDPEPVRNTCMNLSSAAVGLVVISIVLAAPAAATGRHDLTGPDSTTATESSNGEAAAAEDPSPATDDMESGAEQPAASPPVTPDLPTASPPDGNSSIAALDAGHDKCKNMKKDRRLLPWCTDPNSGWMSASTMRAASTGGFTREMCEANGYRPSVRCPSVRVDRR
jgi:hypothetical protein